jgi:hypothetical protein
LQSFREINSKRDGVEPSQSYYEEADVRKGKVDYMQLASQVQTIKDLFLVVKNNLVPEDLPENLRPTDLWLKKMAEENKSNLNSFSFKKKLMGEIHDRIYDEIKRKTTVMQMGESLAEVSNKIDALNNDYCSLFHNRDENAIRAKQAPLVRQLQMMYELEPAKADRLVQSRADPFINKWFREPVHDHTATIK